ncbi:MAG: LysM peptidoglycan-binding domain-containing protein [Anaerolineae bacterium]
MKKIFLTQALVIGLAMALLAFVPCVVYSQPVTPTTEWVNFYGVSSTLDGQPLPIGAVVAAFDPNGVKCGEFTVHKAGSYGLMPCYRDDPLTSADEGAQPGDAISFTINGLSATQLGPDAAVWTANGDLKHIELSAVSPAPPPPPPPPSPPPPSPPPPSPAPCEGFYYTVRRGDWLYSIARRFGVSAAAILRCNSLANPNYLSVGQRLLIPTGAPSPAPQPPPPPSGQTVYIVRRGDTLYSIARRFSTTARAIARANGLLNPNYIYVGQRLVIPAGVPAPPCGRYYTVQRGDTLWRIALRYRTTVWAIATANNLGYSYIIYPGQVLVIP